MTQATTRIFGAPGSGGIDDISSVSDGSAIRRPGPLVFGPDGNLWLTQQQDSRNSVDAGLFVMENPTTDLSFKDLGTNDYRNIAISPSGIDVASDQHVYISQNGTGVVKIRYTAAPANDADGDGVADNLDNCTVDQNPMQTDADNDGYGNLCDADIDNNGIVNFEDLGRLRLAFFTADPVADFNSDGIVNFTDLGIMRTSFLAPPGPIGIAP